MRRTCSLSLLFVVCSSGLWAQAGAGSGAVSGVVKEALGDGLPETIVTLSNQALGLRRTMTTTEDGLFTAPALNPGSGYRLKLTHKGFVDWDSGDFEVSTGQTVNFEVTLKRAPGTEQMEDSSIPAPRVRELKAGTSTLVTYAQVEGLPSDQHRIDPFVQLTPTASTDDRTGRTVITGQPFSNVVLVDGIGTTNSYYQERPALAPQLSLDATYELQTMSADYPAEFGGAMGGVVNASTRSGSENYHGAAYEYFRDRGLTAPGRYSLGQSMLDRQNQFGATVGGPIRRDNLFFLANAEVLDGRADGLNRITTPLLADPFGMSIPASNCKATAAQCAAALAFLKPQLNAPVALTDRVATGFARVDYRRSDRNQFTFVGNAMNALLPNGGSLDDVAANGGLLGLRNTGEQVRYGKAGWTSAMTPNSVNEMRFGLYQDRLSDPASQPGLSTGNLGIIVAGAIVGNPHPNASSLSEHRREWVDNVTITSNTHTLRLGGDIAWNTDWITQLNAAGTYVYPSLTSFAEDFTAGGRNYSYFTQDLGTAARKLPTRQINLYAMDTWRPVQRLTIVAGVRWERPHRPQPDQTNPDYYQTGTITSPIIDFAPRVSLAYQADERTVVRLGYAWFYAPMPGQLLDALYLGNGLDLTNITVNPNQTGAPAFRSLVPSGSIPTGTTNLIYASAKLRDPHTEQWNLAIDRSLGRDTTVTISGIRNRGYNLWSLTDVNLTPPTVTKTYAVDNAAGQQTGSYSTLIWAARQDVRYAHIYNVLNAGASWYNAASIELRKRMSHGVSVQAAYTWSQSLDDVGGPTVGGFVPLNSIDNSVLSDKGDSPFDQRHRVTVNWTWRPTVAGIGSPVLRRIVNGWALSGIGTFASGHPVTPLVLVAGQQFSGTTMAYTTSLNGAGGWSRSPFDSIGSLNTGSQYNVDARLSRTIDFTERLKGVLMFEAFNALNTQFDTGINAVAYTAIPTAPPAGAVTGPQTGVIHPVTGAGTGNVASDARRCQIAFRLVF